MTSAASSMRSLSGEAAGTQSAASSPTLAADASLGAEAEMTDEEFLEAMLARMTSVAAQADRRAAAASASKKKHLQKTKKRR